MGRERDRQRKTLPRTSGACPEYSRAAACSVGLLPALSLAPQGIPQPMTKQLQQQQIDATKSTQRTPLPVVFPARALHLLVVTGNGGSVQKKDQEQSIRKCPIQEGRSSHCQKPRKLKETTQEERRRTGDRPQRSGGWPNPAGRPCGRSCGRRGGKAPKCWFGS